MQTLAEKKAEIFEQRAVIQRALDVVREGDVPDAAAGILYNLCLDGWTLTRVAPKEAE